MKLVIRSEKSNYGTIKYNLGTYTKYAKTESATRTATKASKQHA